MSPAPKKLPVITPEPVDKWSLERLIPYRDLILTLGFGFVVGGVAAIYKPAAAIIAGAGLIFISWRMAK